MKSTLTTKRIQPRQKPSDRPAKTDERITDQRTLSQARRWANTVTRHFPMRQWAMWTHHQKHGWWSHVVAGAFDQIKFTRRDLDDLRSCWQRCQDDARFDKELLAALDNIKAHQFALDVAVDEARSVIRRKARQ